MKTRVLSFVSASLVLLLPATGRLLGQTSAAPARVALISESDGLSPVSDLLTVELSAKPQLQVLERAQIQKVYREQQLSAVNRDYVKLGQVLGADGLLLMGMIAEGTNKFVSIRLIAVKPGVAIGSVRAPWPISDAPGWTRWAANRLAPLLPKLTVPASNAVPISVVNLRSAVRSRVAQETERQLTPLLIERLTRERELFVLERQRMDLLSGEKELQEMGASAFWSGSFLLDGVIDRDGYSQSNLTLHVDLVPRAGGAPLQFEVRARRDDLAGVVNQLAAKLKEKLQLKSGSMAWSASEEAARFLEEAEWALKWDMVAQAKSAADSAWALGERNAKCAVLRVKAYAVAATPDTGGYEGLQFGEEDPAQRLRGTSNAPALEAAVEEARLAVQYEIAEMARQYPDRMLFAHRGYSVTFLMVRKPPQAQEIEQARQLLELYYDLSRTLMADEPDATGAWRRVGVEALSVASQVLQHFHMAPKAQQPVAEQLVQLRAQARRVADWITTYPAGSDAGRASESLTPGRELAGEAPEAVMASCKLTWGYFWSERPEEALAQYRQLMADRVLGEQVRKYFLYEESLFRPVVPYMASSESEVPPLAAWNDADRKRLVPLWDEFQKELKRTPPPGPPPYARLAQPPHGLPTASTNRISPPSGLSPTAGFELMKAHLSTNAPFAVLRFQLVLPVVLYSQEQARELLPLLAAYRSNCVARVAKESGPDRASTLSCIAAVDAADLQLQRRLNLASPPVVRAAPAIDLQERKAFLTNQTPYGHGFDALFMAASIAKEQAAELAPLLAAYKSNLLAQAQAAATEADQWSLAANVRGVEAVEQGLERVLAQTRPKPPTPVTRNALRVTRFFPIPQGPLKLGKKRENLSAWAILEHRLAAGRLWLDVRYNNLFLESYPNGGSGWPNTNQTAFAALNLQDMSWEIIRYPAATAAESAWIPTAGPGPTSLTSAPGFNPVDISGGGLQMVLTELSAVGNGELFVSGPDSLSIYRLKTRRWETQKAPWQCPSGLFVIGSRLFAANADTILEITAGNRDTRILASGRRKPAGSVLDSVGSYGTVTLTPGPGGSPRAVFGRNIYGWDGRDWHPILTATNCQRIQQVAVFEDATLLKLSRYGESAGLWLLPHDRDEMELCLAEPRKTGLAAFARNLSPPATVVLPAPTWTSPANLAINSAAGLATRSNLLVLADRSVFTNNYGEEQRPIATEQDGRHADLLVFERGIPAPMVVSLKFVSDSSLPPGSIYRWAVATQFNRDCNWLALTPEWLLLGQNDSPGVWAIPRAELDAAIARERQLSAASPPTTVAHPQSQP